MKRKSLSRTRRHKKKLPCYFCKNPEVVIDYKGVEVISRFLTSRGKIIGSIYSGTCARHQRQLSRAIKRARVAALLPYTETHALI